MEGLSQNEKIIWSCWDDKSPREVVREAAAKGTHIKLAIKYLTHKNGWSDDVANDWFYAEVKAWTVQLLMRKQIFKVLHVLNKVQIDIEDHLMTLAQESSVIEYRDFIVEHLVKTEKDIKNNYLERWHEFKRHWNLLRYLEKSFEADGVLKQNKVFGIGKDRVIVTESEMKAMTIEKIVKYPEQWKSRVATNLFFDCFEISLLDFLSPLQVWYHLLEQNKAMVLVRWINMQMSEVVRDMNARFNFFNNESFVNKLLNIDTKSMDNRTIDKLDDVFRRWSITPEMIGSIKNSTCFEYTKMCIYDTFCSYGIVNDEERNNLYSIVSRLARTQNLKLTDDIFTETCSTMSKREFNIELAKFCVTNRLYKVLTICVDGDMLGDDFSDVEQDARECIELWLSFKSIEHTSDRQSHVVPVYKTCEQIAKGNIEDYITTNPYLVLGMLLLEDNAKLFDIFSDEEYLNFKDFKLPNKGYSDKLPHLYNVYQKFAQISRCPDVRDVNVYQLLSGYRGLDVSKIFEFQLVNENIRNINNEKADRRSLGSLLSNEVIMEGGRVASQKLMEMPHFANEKLMKKHGHVTKLNHIYYLKQYRPCNASQAFVAHQYQLYNRLQDKSIKSACCEAHALALQNWSDPAMTACAVSFVAMIGYNPTRCRVQITAARMMKEQLIQDGVAEELANKTVNEYMTRLAQGNDNAPAEILKNLEDITIKKVRLKQEGDSKIDMAHILYESQTMVKFAVLHNLTLPEEILRQFIEQNMWFNFLVFADVFRYPLNQMLQLTQEFENKSYSEHMRNIMLHRSVEEVSDKELKPSTVLQRRLSRLNSAEVSPTHSSSFEFPEVVGGDLWEVCAASHGPEDPPGALVRAAGLHREPLLALVATCYEPNAVGVLWAYWVLATLGDSVPQALRDSLQWDISQQHPTNEEFQQVTELCLEAGYVRTLHESMIVFFSDSPITMLTAFLCRSIWQRLFDSETCKLLYTFTQHCQRKYSVDSSLTWLLPKNVLQRIAVSLVKIALCSSFDSALLQKEFLRCLNDVSFGKEFSVPTPNYNMIYEVLNISMETSSVVSVAKMLSENSQEYLTQLVQSITKDKNYTTAYKIAKLAGVSVDNVLTAEWSNKRELIDDKENTLFIAQSSEAFKSASVTFKTAINFLSHYANEISNTVQKFYAYRIILSWFEDHLEYGSHREQLEHLMWDCYFSSDDPAAVYLHSCQTTTQYVLSGLKETTQTRAGLKDKPFSSLLAEIEIESDVANIENVVLLEEVEKIDVWRKAMQQFLELNLSVEAFRLQALFVGGASSRHRAPACPAQVVRTCLRLAEGLCAPYDLPQDLRLVISAPFMQSKLSISETSDASFEELVLIQERSEPPAEGGAVGGVGGALSALAAREDADRLGALDALAARTSLTLCRRIANYYRLSIQLGCGYTAVLKHNHDPIQFIGQVSGRAKMPLANLVFRTFNVPSKQVAEYLCLELVSAIISPHLVKTTTFRQKEHFQYTLWGYALNADLEMFLNMRPDACTQIGRLMLDYLTAFQRMYRASAPARPAADDDIDVDALVDDEYQNVDEAEVESLTGVSVITGESATTGASAATGASATSGASATTTSADSVSAASTVYSLGNRISKDSRRNLFDTVTSNKVHIPYEIKSNIRKVTKGAKLTTKQVHVICVELLVVCAECAAVSCDPEGVAVSLRSAQALAGRLAAARSWRLLVRLLTGMARYTEMAYVFQMLRDNHQFEFLLGQFDYVLGQQQDKINEFKQGLLDFLKNHCPGDTDTYVMVALHFNMYAEAAAVKRKQALDLIKDLEKAATDAARTGSKKAPEWLQIHDQPWTRRLLETALEQCADAAELFLQAAAVGLAGEMAALAQQLALQVSLLNASPTRLILNRSTEQVYRLVTEYLSFLEGLVLMRACGGAQWRELYYRRALGNDQVYLRDMATYRPDVALDFLERYKTEKKTTPASEAAMKELKNYFR